MYKCTVALISILIRTNFIFTKKSLFQTEQPFTYLVTSLQVKLQYTFQNFSIKNGEAKKQVYIVLFWLYSVNFFLLFTVLHYCGNKLLLSVLVCAWKNKFNIKAKALYLDKNIMMKAKALYVDKNMMKEKTDSALFKCHQSFMKFDVIECQTCPRIGY